MKIKLSLIVIGLCISMISFGQSKKKVRKLIRDSEVAKTEFLRSDFQMKDHFENAYAYVIFPNVGKGAVGVGGATGTGIVYERGRIVGVANLTQLSIGFQFGGQAYREIIFFETEKQLDDLKKNKIKLAAQASAVAATEGASADAKYDKGVMVFTMQKGGLMYEASVGGQKFKFKPYNNKK
ncbi:MAG: hypothetical protein CL663_06650 [Bacteroidetes bacterium]|nr:hypothetical protein [Bacteroidota bacterium]